MANEAEPTIVQVNFGLKARHIVAAFTFIAGLLGAGGAAGYFFIPAKAVDLSALTAVVEGIRAEQVQMRQTVASLTSQTEQLSDAVDGLRLAVDALPRRRADVAPERPRKVVRAQKKRPVTAAAGPEKGGLFGGL